MKKIVFESLDEFNKNKKRNILNEESIYDWLKVIEGSIKRFGGVLERTSEGNAKVTIGNTEFEVRDIGGGESEVVFPEGNPIEVYTHDEFMDLLPEMKRQAV